MSIKLDQSPVRPPEPGKETKVDLSLGRLSFGRLPARNPEAAPATPLESIQPGQDLFLSSGRFTSPAGHNPQTLAAARGRGLNCKEANRDCRERTKAMWVRSLAQDLENA